MPSAIAGPSSSTTRKREAGDSVDELRRAAAASSGGTIGMVVGKEAKLEQQELFEAEATEDDDEFLEAEPNQPSTDHQQPSTTIGSARLPGARHPAWLGTHRHLQAAIAAIDDRLFFLRICEELEARGIRYEQITVEPLVGGHMLKLIDTSSIVRKHGVECTEFFRNLLRCNIRLNLPDGISQLECTFINPPLVPDYERSEEEVEADREKPHTHVLPMTQRHRDITSQGQAIALNIEERLLSYSCMYLPVRQFSDVYNAHYRHFCNIRAFTYHKLVLSYGDRRDLLLVLSWRWNWQSRMGKYALCFGQAPRANPQNGQLTALKQSRWNPHMLVSPLLVERFNRDQDLTWLVNYLVNTHRSLGTIYNFVRTQMHSTKVAAQVLGIEATFPAELTSNLIPVDEHVIRLCYGQIAMEFMLLNDNQVAVRDSTVVYGTSASSSAPTLADFWRAFQQQQQSLGSEMEEEEEEGGEEGGGRNPSNESRPVADQELGEA